MLWHQIDGWEQPSYKEVFEIIRQRSERPWGHPVDKIAALWSLCPEITQPSNAEELKCDQATCALVCNDGFVAIGRRRVKCRYNKKKGFFWKREIGVCQTCSEIVPPNGTTVDCAINPKSKKSICSLSCENGNDFEVSDWLSEVTPHKVKLKCKCPRQPFVDGTTITMKRSCGWYSNKIAGLSPVSDAQIAAQKCLSPTMNPPTTRSLLTCSSDDDCSAFLEQCTNSSPGGPSCRCVKGACLPANQMPGLQEGEEIISANSSLFESVNVNTSTFEVDVDFLIHNTSETETILMDINDQSGSRIVTGEFCLMNRTENRFKKLTRKKY